MQVHGWLDFNLFAVVLGSDVIYSQTAVTELVSTLTQLSGLETTIFLAEELRNGDFRLKTFSCNYSFLKMIYLLIFNLHADAVLEYFLDVAKENFQIGHVDQTHWHPDYCTRRVAMFVLVKKCFKC